MPVDPESSLVPLLNASCTFLDVSDLRDETACSICLQNFGWRTGSETPVKSAQVLLGHLLNDHKHEVKPSQKSRVKPSQESRVNLNANHKCKFNLNHNHEYKVNANHKYKVNINPEDRINGPISGQKTHL
ncbi:MAG: hypothetical protein Q9206_006100 [Seirophora lacunosa]